MQMYLLHKNIDMPFSLAVQEKSMSDFEKLCEEFAKTGIVPPPACSLAQTTPLGYISNLHLKHQSHVC